MPLTSKRHPWNLSCGLLRNVNCADAKRATLKYQIESSHTMVGPLLPEGGVMSLRLNDHALAIVVAAKSVTVPYGREIRVVHLASGEVIFRKTAATVTSVGEE